jgi:outer membrane protein TolC
MARVRITNLARKMSREVREAVENVTMLKRRLASAENMKKRVEGQIDVVKRQIELGRAEPLDLYAARLAALKTDARYHRIYFEFKTAVLNLEKVRGTLLNKDVTEKLTEQRPGPMEDWEKNEK